MEPDTTIVLNGLVLAGAPLVLEESADAETRRLVLRHCTLVPGITRDPDGAPHSVGRASLIVLHPFAEVVLDHCVVGPVVAVEGAEVTANDSVIDASAERRGRVLRPRPRGRRRAAHRLERRPTARPATGSSRAGT